jgi:hypothetical protein
MGSTVTTTPLVRIAELLREVGAPGSFAARRTAAADDLHLEVTGVGRLRFPISRTQAQRLCRVARPARHGKGAQTLLDRQVRDTWEVIVLWPRERAFAVRAEASPPWALEALGQRLRAGAVSEAQGMAASLLPFWDAVAAGEEGRGFFAKTLRVAEGLDRPALAASLLRPFRVEALGPGGPRAFVALVGRYGEAWVRSLLSGWSDPRRSWSRFDGPDRLPWLASLSRLCRSLRAADEATGTRAGRLLLQDRWEWLKMAIEERRRHAPPSRRDQALAELSGPILGWLESAAVVAAAGLRDEAVTFLCAGENEALLPSLVHMLRAASTKGTTAMRATPGLDAIGRHCTGLLRARLDVPARSESDWSIALPRDCRCALCGRLSAFLADAGTRRLEWPLAKEGRGQVHGRIDSHELPVRHETRRSGRPYTLVLEKTKALFEREVDERRRGQADLEWLAGLTDGGGAG